MLQDAFVCSVDGMHLILSCVIEQKIYLEKELSGGPITAPTACTYETVY